MKNLLALILVGSMLLLTGCAKKEVASDDSMDEMAPVAEEAPVMAEEPAPEPEPVVAMEEEPEPEPVIERAADKIFFEFDSDSLTPVAKKALEGNAIWLQAQPEISIVIEGYADERGSEKYNMALSEKRAKAARDYLVTLGVAPERITTVSYGEEKAAKGAGETAWAQDRRVEFVASN